MGDETTVDRNDPELKYLTVEKNQFNDPATQAEWTQKRLVWVPHETQVSPFKFQLRSAIWLVKCVFERIFTESRHIREYNSI